MDSGFRNKYIYEPALNWYPDVANRLHMKTLKRFCKKHRHI